MEPRPGLEGDPGSENAPAESTRGQNVGAAGSSSDVSQDGTSQDGVSTNGTLEEAIGSSDLSATEPAGETESAQGAEAVGPVKGVSARNSVLEALILVLLALILALTLKTYVAEAYEIKGRSMVPTFADGQRVVVLKLLYDVERGDIVIFSSKEDPTKDLIKRVIGLPGEFVRIADGKVHIDEVLLDEKYINDPRYGRFDISLEQTLGENEYFVLGDNRDDSHDSRKFGPVGSDKLKGKVVVRWWPFHEVSTF